MRGTWQDIEERLGSDPDDAEAQQQYVWGLRYIDEIILRDRDTDDNGTLNERLYAIQDANWNVVALASTLGNVVERYTYSPYGTYLVHASTFANRPASSYEWSVLFGGYQFDELTGIYLAHHRNYLPLLGWPNRDPLRYSDGSCSLSLRKGRSYK